jgi:hypothetical protein
VSLDPCSGDETASDVLRVCLGPPALNWSMRDLVDPLFPACAYSVLKPHVQAAKHNRIIRSLHLCDHVRWVTGQPPEGAGWSSQAGQGYAPILTSMFPAFRALAEEVSGAESGQSSSVPAILAFFQWMRQQGVDPDPNNTLLLTLLHGMPVHERRTLKRRLRRFGWEVGFHGEDVWFWVTDVDDE